MLLKGLPQGWRIALDPLLISWPGVPVMGRSAVELDNLAFSYDTAVIANRALMILIAAACLAILYIRFSAAEQSGKDKRNDRLTTINLVTGEERLYRETESTGLR